MTEGAKTEAAKLRKQSQNLEAEVNRLMDQTHRLTVAMNQLEAGYNPAEFHWQVSTWAALNLSSCYDHPILTSLDEVVDTKAITKQLKRVLSDWIMEQLGEKQAELRRLMERVRLKMVAEPADIKGQEPAEAAAEPA
jgi:hypothetical protein